MFVNTDMFIDQIQNNFDADDGIEEWQREALKSIIAQDFFMKELMMPKSEAAAFLCHWVKNIIDYN